MPEFDVEVESPTGDRQFVSLDVTCRAKAAHGAEVQNPNWRAIAVVQRSEVVGRCVVCNAVVFSDERKPPLQGVLRCPSC